MRIVATTCSIVFVLSIVSAAAVAQDHEHAGGPGVAIAYDGGSDAGVIAGQPATFTVLVLDEAMVPAFHQQMHIRATVNGVVVWETTPDSGHDYDGVNQFTVTFPTSGAYEVAVLDEGNVLASLAGSVAPAPGAPVEFELTLPESVSAQEPVPVGIVPVGPMGHWNAIVDVRDGAGVVYRTTLHGHDASPQEFEVALQDSGTYTVRAVLWSGAIEGVAATAPAVREGQFDVSPAVFADPTALPAPRSDADLNRVVEGDATDPYRLIGTFDPWTVVGPDTQQHLGVIVADHNGTPVRHINLQARLVSPAGIVLFSSDQLHEYDGVYYLTTRQSVPGEYTWEVEASRGDWSGSFETSYTVIPPVQELGPTAGPQTVEVAGVAGLSAGGPAAIELAATDAAGRPFTHSEVDIEIADPETGVPLLMTKVHTHADGLFPFTTAFDAAGQYELRMSPFPLEARPVIVSPATETLSVAEGPGFPASDLEDILPTSADADEAPGVPLALVLLGLVGLAVGRRR